MTQAPGPATAGHRSNQSVQGDHPPAGPPPEGVTVVHLADQDQALIILDNPAWEQCWVELVEAEEPFSY